MKNFNEFWVEKAQRKAITIEDVITRCVLKTIIAKSENKEEVLNYYLGKAFSPSSRKTPPYKAAQNAAKYVQYRFRTFQEVFFLKKNEFLETNEEIEMFMDLLTKAENYGN